VPQSQIATVAAGSSGLASAVPAAQETDDADKDAKKDPAAEKAQKKGFGLGSLASGMGGGDKKSGQTVASGGARGLDPEVDAKGGPNPAIVSVSVSRADIDTFRKDGKLA
jgi:hypothetical protein